MPSSESRKNCKNCKFWVRTFQIEPDPEFAVGQCRRFPPQVFGVTEDESMPAIVRSRILAGWPVTSWDGWCGEWVQQDVNTSGVNDADYYVDIDHDEDDDDVDDDDEVGVEVDVDDHDDVDNDDDDDVGIEVDDDD